MNRSAREQALMFLVNQIIGANFDESYYDERIKFRKEDIGKLNEEKIKATTKEEKERIEADIQKQREYINMVIREKNIAANQILKIQNLVREYTRCAKKIRLDGGVCGSLEENRLSPVYGNEVKLNNDVIKDLLNLVLSEIAKSNKNVKKIKRQLYKKENIEKENMGKQGDEIIEELKKTIYNDKVPRNKRVHVSYHKWFKGINETDKERCSNFHNLLKCEKERIFDTLILEKHRLLLSENKLKKMTIEKGWRKVDIDLNVPYYYGDLYQKTEELFPEINKIQNLLKDNNLTNQQINILKKSLDFYKEALEHFVNYQVLDFCIKNIHNTTTKMIQKLKQVSEKEKVKFLNKERDAKQLYYSIVNEKTNFKTIENHIEEPIKSTNVDLEKIQEAIDKDKTSDSYGITTEHSIEHKKPSVSSTNIELEQKQEEKLTEIDLLELSSVYRTRYINEVIKKTELGQMNYSAFLKKIAPDQTELIKYIEKREQQAKTIYEEYLNYVVRARESSQQIQSFEEFIYIKYNCRKSDLETIVEYEAQIKGVKR